MKFREFIDSSSYLLEKYFSSLYTEISTERIKLEVGKILFPNLSLFTETKEHFILELFGAANFFSRLKSFTHKCSSTTSYFGQFEGQKENPIITFTGRSSGLSTLLLSNKVDLEDVKKRFGFISDQWKTHLSRSTGNGALFSFGDNFKSCYFDNCLIINRLSEIYRVKYILGAELISKNFSEEDYAYDLNRRLTKKVSGTHELYGIHYIPDTKYEGYAISGQFANIFLLPKLRETRIGEFIRKHPAFIERTLDCKSFLYNKRFDWVESNNNTWEKFIQPDLMLERTDGYYDICDLKTAAMSKKRITKGHHRRRRFIDYAEEGIAQLANYEDYFKYEKNAELAWSKYKVKVKNPRLILVVGSYENTSREEINEAIRKLKPNYHIIDYDTLNSLFLTKSLLKSNQKKNNAKRKASSIV